MTLVTRLGRMSDRMTDKLLLQHEADDALDQVRAKLGVVRKAQLSAIMATSRPMMLANIFNAAALISLEHYVGRLVFETLVWAALLIAFAAYGLVSAHRFFASTARETASHRAPGKIVLSSLCLALIWCYPLVAIVPTAELLQMAFLSALIAGMIAGGALALYPVPLAGILYTTLLSVVAYVSLLSNGLIPIVPFGMVIAAFVCVVVYSVKRHTSMFLCELLGRFDAERQRDVTSLLLNTFQGEGGHYLWRSDVNGGVKTCHRGGVKVCHWVSRLGA